MSKVPACALCPAKAGEPCKGPPKGRVCPWTKRTEHEVATLQRACAHRGCRNVITNFAYPAYADPQTVDVWCRTHQREAIQR